MANGCHGDPEVIDPDKCQMTHYPAPVLGKSALPIDKIDDAIRELADKMGDLMVKHKGIGLAGPQAGVPLRIFVISLSGSKKDLKVFINPTVTPTTDQVEPNEEGCLSIPNVYTNIGRYTTCEVTATDLEGNEFTEEADGLYARALQHEYDHIEGMTIADRMASTAKIAHRRQFKKLQKEFDKEL